MSRDFDQLNQAVTKLLTDVAGIKDQSATITALTASNDDLKSQVAALTAQVNTLTLAAQGDETAMDALAATVEAADAGLQPAAPEAPALAPAPAPTSTDAPAADAPTA